VRFTKAPSQADARHANPELAADRFIELPPPMSMGLEEVDVAALADGRPGCTQAHIDQHMNPCSVFAPDG